VVSRAKEATERHDLVQALYAPVCFGFSRSVVYGEEQTGEQLEDKERERDTAETVEIIDPSGHRFVHDAAVPARESHAFIEIVE
jgi:hypothetical protein